MVPHGPTYAQLEILCPLRNPIAGWRAGGPLSELAAAEKVDRGYPGKMLRLTLLAPDIVQVIRDGRQLPEAGLSFLLEPLPHSSDEQRRAIANAAQRSSPACAAESYAR